jgi:hypothetical protein
MQDEDAITDLIKIAIQDVESIRGAGRCGPATSDC